MFRKVIALVELLALRFLGAFSSILVIYVVASMVDLGGAGDYAVSLVIIQLLSIATKAGLDIYVLKYVSSCAGNDGYNYLARALICCVAFLFLFYIAFGCLYQAGLGRILTGDFYWMIFSILFINLNSIFCEFIRASGSNKIATFNLETLLFVVFIIEIYVADYFLIDIDGILGELFLIASAISLLFTVLLLIYLVRDGDRLGSVLRQEFRQASFTYCVLVIRNGYTYAINNLLEQGISSIPVIYVYIFGGSEMAAIVRIIVRLGMVPSFVAHSINNLLARVYAKLHSDERFSELNRTNNAMVVYALGLSATIGILLVYMGDEIVSFIASTNIEGYQTELFVVVAAQVLYSVYSPLVPLIQMSSKPIYMTKATFFAFVTGAVFLLLSFTFDPVASAVASILVTRVAQVYLMNQYSKLVFAGV